MTDTPPPGCCGQGGNCPHCRLADLVVVSLTASLCPNCGKVFENEEP